MIKIALFIPNHYDAISVYRGVGVFSHLRKIMPLITAHEYAHWNWTTLCQYDAVYFSRPSTINEFEGIKLAKEYNLPVWVDYDDNLFDIPISNPASHFYDKQAQERVKQIIKLADAISVSTEALKEAIGTLNKNIHVIPNAWPDHLIDFDPKITQRPKNKHIVWRGSKSHDRDLTLAHDAIRMARDYYPDWTFVFMGEPFWQTVDLIQPERRVVVKPIEPFVYLKTLYNLNPDIMLVPLEDTCFNRCKSNIAWIEGSYAGATVIAPSWDEWDNPGVDTYDAIHGIKETLKDAIEGIFPSSNNESAKSYIKEHLMLSKVNYLRKGLLESLVGKV